MGTGWDGTGCSSKRGAVLFSHRHFRTFQTIMYLNLAGRILSLPTPLQTPYCSLDCSDRLAHTLTPRREDQGPKCRELYKHWAKAEGYLKDEDKIRL